MTANDLRTLLIEQGFVDSAFPNEQPNYRYTKDYSDNLTGMYILIDAQDYLGYMLYEPSMVYISTASLISEASLTDESGLNLGDLNLTLPLIEGSITGGTKEFLISWLNSREIPLVGDVATYENGDIKASFTLRETDFLYTITHADQVLFNTAFDYSAVGNDPFTTGIIIGGDSIRILSPMGM